MRSGNWIHIHGPAAVASTLFRVPRRAEPVHVNHVLADLRHPSHNGGTGFLFVWPAGLPVVRVATQLGVGAIAALWAVYWWCVCRSLCGRVFARGVGPLGTRALGKDAGDCAEHFRHAAVSNWHGARYLHAL